MHGDELALTLAAQEGDRYALQLLVERHERGLEQLGAALRVAEGER